MRRLTAKEIAVERERLRAEQHGRCALCALPCSAAEAVLDHDHGSGAVRAALHRSCNALLGKVENNAGRYGVRNLGAFCAGVAGYLQRHLTNQTGLLHPTHKTDEEKRVRRNKLARTRRAKKGTP